MSKQQIYFYKLYLFSHKEEDDYIYLEQEEGQKLSMILTTDNSRKFIMINDNVINTSSIEQLVKCENTIFGSGYVKINEIRELTPKEEQTQKLFDEFKNNVKLLK